MVHMLTVKEQWRWLIGKGQLLHIAMKYVLTSARKCMTNRRYDVKNIMQFTFPWIKGADNCGPLMGIGSYAIQFVCIRFRSLRGFERKLQYVDTCPNSPQVGMAFCQNHCVVAAEQGIPTQLREYCNYLAASKSLCTTAPVSDSTTNVADCQGMPLTENQSSSRSEKQTQCMCN